MKKLHLSIALGLAALTLPLAAADQPKPLVVDGNAFNNKPIPVALKGYNGEIARVVKFDLEVMGCKIVPEDQAAYILEGGNNGQVNGLLKDAAGNFGFNRRYNGGQLRDQAHALCNDVIGLLREDKNAGIAHTRIVYKMRTGARSYEVFMSDYDGNKPVKLTNDATIVESPRWAPGNDEIVYTSWMTIGGIQNTTVVRHDLGNGKRNVFARFKGLNTGGTVSPQGSVAMILSKGVNPDVFVAPPHWEFLKDIPGRQLQHIVRSEAAESSPEWSPDGRWLCYATRVSGRRTLVKVPAQGGAGQRIATPGAINPSDPSWSPDGKLIAFTSQTGKFFNIWVVPVAGGAPTLVCAGEDPSWAPNSRNLMFTRRGVNKRVLGIVDVPTKQVKMLSAFSGSASQPDWQN